MDTLVEPAFQSAALPPGQPGVPWRRIGDRLLSALLLLMALLLTTEVFAAEWMRSSAAQPAGAWKASSGLALVAPVNNAVSSAVFDPITHPLWSRAAGFPGGEMVTGLVADPTGAALYAMSSGHDLSAQELSAGLYRSADGGATWLQIGQQSLPKGVPLALTVGADGAVYVALAAFSTDAGQDGGLYRSADGGQTWSQLLQLPDAAATLSLAADPTNPKVVYAGESDNGLYRSADGGQTWSHLSINASAAQLAILQIGVAPWDERQIVVIAVAPEGTAVLLRSADVGRTWKPITSAMPRGGIDGVTAFAFSPASSRAHLLYARLGGYLDNGGLLLVSADEGAHWRQLTNALQTRSTMSSIALDPTRPQRVYTACYQGAGLAATSDGGAHWHDLAKNQSFPAAQNGSVFALLVNPASGTLLAGTADGVWLDQGQ